MGRLSPYALFRNKHEGETANFILNGPSLNQVPLKEIETPEITTFGGNLVYKSFIPTYYVNTGQDHFSEPSMIEEVLEVLDNPLCHAGFINRLVIHCFRHTKAYSVLSSASYPGHPVEAAYGFSMDPLVTLGVMGSVLYPMFQLAYYMGFKEVRLIGFDYNYEKGNEHFYPDDPRFTDISPGKKYDYDNELWRRINNVVMEACNSIYEADGRRIINWTPESYCSVFESETPPWLEI